MEDPNTSTLDRPHQEIAPHKGLSIFITGFGEFAGVSVNPTTLLIKHFAENAAQYSGRPDTRQWYGRIRRMDILEVSVESVKEYFQELERAIADCSDRTVLLLLHLGVDASARTFDLETTGVNEATFRAPDQCGNTPHCEPISTALSDSIAHSLQTPIDAETLAIEIDRKMRGIEVRTPAQILATKDPLVHAPAKCGLEDKASSVPAWLASNSDRIHKGSTVVQTSTNAGRFLCNYIYYTSLLFAHQRSTDTLHILPLFVHVPSQDTISLESQVRFVEHLISSLYYRAISLEYTHKHTHSRPSLTANI